MKLLIKQRVFTLTDTYDIYDENGNVRYYVEAEFLTLGHQLHVYEAGGREIGMISQKLFCFTPTFDIIVGGRDLGTIQKKFTFFTPEYEIDFNGWTVEGDFLGWDYDVYSGGRTIMHISKEILNWGDTYSINILNPEDELMGMMLVVAIDAAVCSQKN